MNLKSTAHISCIDMLHMRLCVVQLSGCKTRGLWLPHTCVTILSIVFQWPWQTVHRPGPSRQPWQHHILEQPKMLSRIMGLLFQSCHPRGRVLRNKTGICLDMTKMGTPHPTAMEDDTGKVDRTQRQVQWASEWDSKRWPLEGEGLNPPKKHGLYSQLLPVCHQTDGRIQALIRQCYEWNLRCTCFWLVLIHILFLPCHL